MSLNTPISLDCLGVSVWSKAYKCAMSEEGSTLRASHTLTWRAVSLTHMYHIFWSKTTAVTIFVTETGRSSSIFSNQTSFVNVCSQKLKTYWLRQEQPRSHSINLWYNVYVSVKYWTKNGSVGWRIWVGVCFVCICEYGRLGTRSPALQVCVSEVAGACEASPWR